MTVSFIKKLSKGQVMQYVALFIVFTIVTLIFYHGISQVYFQQDEWFKDGKSIYYVYSNFSSLWTRRFGFHYYPFLNIFFILQYLIFKLHVVWYSYTNIFFQSAITILLFTFLKKIFGSIRIAFFLSFLFLINPGIQQVILNEMVSSSYKIPLLLMLVSFLILWNAIQKPGVLTTKIIIILSVLYIVSVAFFESSLVLLILLPVFFLLFKRRDMVFRFNFQNICILVFIFLLTILRLVMQNKLPVDAPLPIQGSFLFSTLYNAISMPPKFLIEYLFGLSTLLYFADIYSVKIFSYLHEPGINLALITITTGYEMVVYFLTIIFTFLTSILLVITYNKSKIYSRGIRVLVFSIIWLITNSVVIAPQGRIFTSVESRYFYISGIGVLLILGSIISIMLDKYKNNTRIRTLIVFGLAAYVVIWSIYSYMSIQSQEQALIKVSKVRVEVISQFKSMFQVLPKNSVFYIYCSDDCSSNELYGMPRSWVVPFQNGLGWTLLTVYSTDDPNRYAPFFSNYLFWDNKTAAYRKIGDTAFGFFTDPVALKLTMKNNSLHLSNIIILKYESKKYKLSRIYNSHELPLSKITTH